MMYMSTCSNYLFNFGRNITGDGYLPRISTLYHNIKSEVANAGFMANYLVSLAEGQYAKISKF